MSVYSNSGNTFGTSIQCVIPKYGDYILPNPVIDLQLDAVDNKEATLAPEIKSEDKKTKLCTGVYSELAEMGKADKLMEEYLTKQSPITFFKKEFKPHTSFLPNPPATSITVQKYGDMDYNWNKSYSHMHNTTSINNSNSIVGPYEPITIIGSSSIGSIGPYGVTGCPSCDKIKQEQLKKKKIGKKKKIDNNSNNTMTLTSGSGGTDLSSVVFSSANGMLMSSNEIKNQEINVSPLITNTAFGSFVPLATGSNGTAVGSTVLSPLNYIAKNTAIGSATLKTGNDTLPYLLSVKHLYLEESVVYDLHCSRTKKIISLQVIENGNEIKIHYGDKSLNLFETFEKQDDENNKKDVSDVELQITI